MEALTTFVFWLGVALGSCMAFGALIVGVLLWWFGPLDTDEEDEK
jgi:hypothetical protein